MPCPDLGALRATMDDAPDGATQSSGSVNIALSGLPSP